MHDGVEWARSKSKIQVRRMKKIANYEWPLDGGSISTLKAIEHHSIHALRAQ
jgi:hypothetical protein